MTSGHIPPEAFASLKSRYTERNRHYHTWTHVEALLGWLEDVRLALYNPYAVELAALWHDAIYDPRAKNNETASAALLMVELEGHAPHETLEEARILILATANHKTPETGNLHLLADCHHFLDMDLAILGAPRPVFDTYETNIRKEYAHVPPADYKAGRSAVLEDFLQRDRLYFTAYFHDRLDGLARDNLNRSLARLR